jgi:hypothetical protein
MVRLMWWRLGTGEGAVPCRTGGVGGHPTLLGNAMCTDPDRALDAEVLPPVLIMLVLIAAAPGAVLLPAPGCHAPAPGVPSARPQNSSWETLLCW